MADEESNYRRETILVVDDAEAIRKMVCAVLAQHGYGCVEACDGHEALSMLKNAAVQLVLTDVLMPGMGGAELANRMAREWPGLRVMFMSGYSDHPVVRNVQQIPTLFLPKPFTTGVLMAKIRQVLDEPWPGLR